MPTSTRRQAQARSQDQHTPTPANTEAVDEGAVVEIILDDEMQDGGQDDEEEDEGLGEYFKSTNRPPANDILIFTRR